MTAIFVTGTDTGVGKTIVCGLLGRFAQDQGQRVVTQKWIQTGSKRFPEDISRHLQIMKRHRQDVRKEISFICPYVFPFAASPHLAATKALKRIDKNKIKQAFCRLQQQYDCVVVEGIGGALVPYNKKRLVIDIARELKLPVLIVVQNKLGAINHTLLTIEAIKKRNMNLIGVVFNTPAGNAQKIIREDNRKIINALTGIKVFGELPYSQNDEVLYSEFRKWGRSIIRRSNDNG
ncbi:MAG: dethiobiotin synthase [PVC group bacterium]|nr:dethiobiotin synthase [PVC group bacterium]